MSKKKEGEVLDNPDASPKPFYGEDLGTKNVSKLLVEARQSLNLSQKEIADQLYLTKTLIQQLEEGKFGELPTKAFVKGYLRSYARVVGLPGDVLIQRFEAEEEEKGSVLEPPLPLDNSSKLTSLSITGSVGKIAVAGITVFVLVVVFVWFLVQGSNNSKELKGALTSSSKSQEMAELEETSPLVLEEDRKFPPISLELDGQKIQDLDDENGVIEQSYSEAPNLEDAKPGTPNLEEISDKKQTAQTLVEEAVLPEVDDDKTKISERVNFERIVVEGKSSIFVTTEGSDELKLVFRGECWTEIEEYELGRIYNDLNVAGDVLTVKGQGPFRLLLGKARSVDMIYNGKPVDLEPYIARDQTAKIRLTD